QLALPALQHRGLVWHACFSRDGRRIVTAGSNDARARVWDAATGKLLVELKHGHWVRYAEFSPDNRFVVTASDDTTARVWDTATLDQIVRLWDTSAGELTVTRLPHEVNQQWLGPPLSPDGRQVVLKSDGDSVRVWDVTTGEAISPPIRHEKLTYRSFSPDGRH